MKLSTINIHKITVALLAVAFTYISFAAILDFHEDNQFHSDCPLCRIQLDSSSTYVYCTTMAPMPLPVYNTGVVIITTIYEQTAVIKTYFPNAPPLS